VSGRNGTPRVGERDGIERLVQQAVDQGHPRTVEDPDTLRNVAAVLRQARAEREQRPQPTAEPLVLDTSAVAVALGYVRQRGAHKGEPDRNLVRRLAREGKIPAPIDDELSPTRWRWSRAQIEAYAAGEWKPRQG
jgi:hypothetical protein